MHGDFQFAYYRTGMDVCSSSLAPSTRTKDIRGSTVVITGRGAPIKKSISPFLGCGDPLDKREREREKNTVSRCVRMKNIYRNCHRYFIIHYLTILFLILICIN